MCEEELWVGGRCQQGGVGGGRRQRAAAGGGLQCYAGTVTAGRKVSSMKLLVSRIKALILSLNLRPGLLLH